MNQALWLRKLFCDLHLKQQNDTEVFVDNQAAIAISHNPVFSWKNQAFQDQFFLFKGSAKGRRSEPYLLQI